MDSALEKPQQVVQSPAEPTVKSEWSLSRIKFY
jgi:hypothetical protein